MTTDRRPFTIICLRRDAEHGFWRARVTNGVTIEVDRRYGSWQADVRSAPGARSFTRRDVLPDVAAALQARVRPTDDAERRARERAAEEARKAAQGASGKGSRP